MDFDSESMDDIMQYVDQQLIAVRENIYRYVVAHNHQEKQNSPYVSSDEFDSGLERGIASVASHAIRTGRFDAERLANPVLRNVGRQAGQAVSDYLFDQTYQGMRGSSSQIAAQLMQSLSLASRIR